MHADSVKLIKAG